MDMVVIESKAMELPTYERAVLADRLLQSLLPVSGSIENAWAKESEDRVVAYRTGQLSAVDGPNAMAELQAKYSK